MGLAQALGRLGTPEQLPRRLSGAPLAGLRFTALKTQLVPLLNGVVSMEIYLPEPTLKFPAIERFLTKCQPRAETEEIDLLGYYIPPYAYAAIGILGKVVQKVGRIDHHKIAEYIHANEFHTVVRNVQFAKNGEWATSRVLYVQFRGIQGHSLDEWNQPGHAIILRRAASAEEN